MAIVILLLAVSLLMSFASVQTYVAQKGMAYVNKEYGSQMEVGKVRYIFPDHFYLNEVYIKDNEGDTLIYTQMMESRIQYFVKNQLYSSGVRLKNPRFYYLKRKGNKESNLNEFVNKFFETRFGAGKSF
ncbi:MAG: hypothetical protein U5L96_04890 [Owenweeksia sp.]|nr:hypothetical protein [Owenweeksia sp.]